MEESDRWYALNEKMEEFMYGDKGVMTTAFVDENLNTYLFDLDKIIELLKELKEIEILQGKLLSEQKEKLIILRNRFLEIDNGKNHIEEMYRRIKNIYTNIEEY